MGRRSRSRGLSGVAAGLTLALGAAGCGSASIHARALASSGTAGTAASPRVTAPSAPAFTGGPASPKTCAFGEATNLGDLELTVGPPAFADHPLSPLPDAYPPRYGLYVSFEVEATDVGGGIVRVDPARFTLEEPDGARATADTGNSPYSGVPHPLDQTFLTPGESIEGTLVFDVGKPHGTLVAAPEGTSPCVFRF